MGVTKDWGNLELPMKGDILRPSDLFQVLKLTKDFILIRPIGPVASIAEHWVEIEKKDGTKARVGIYCLNYDSQTEAPTKENGCLLCELGLRINIRYLFNVILVDSLKKLRPQKHWFKTKENKFFTEDDISDEQIPVKVLNVPISAMRKFMEELDAHDIKYPANHPKKGVDFKIRFDRKKSPAEMYYVSFSRQRPLSDLELKLKTWDLDKLELLVEDKDAILQSQKRIIKRLVDKSIVPEGFLEDEEGEVSKKASSKFSEPDVDIEDFEDEDFGTGSEDLNELEDKIYSMDRKQLKRFIKERELNIKVTKSMDDDEIRELILEELGI